MRRFLLPGSSKMKGFLLPIGSSIYILIDMYILELELWKIKNAYGKPAKSWPKILLKERRKEDKKELREGRE